MNHTESGAIAVGAPNSPARFKEEINHAMKSEAEGPLLMATMEGRSILHRFFQAAGCDSTIMMAEDRRASAITFLEKESVRLDCFLRGALFGISTNLP